MSDKHEEYSKIRNDADAIGLAFAGDDQPRVVFNTTLFSEPPESITVNGITYVRGDVRTAPTELRTGKEG